MYLKDREKRQKAAGLVVCLTAADDLTSPLVFCLGGRLGLYSEQAFSQSGGGMKTACFVCSPTVTPGSRTAGLLSSPNKPQDVDDTHVGLVRQRAVTAASVLCSSKQDVRRPVGLRLCCRCCAWVCRDGASTVDGGDG